ncbi:efflux transporter, RND family, MFP subunit [Desulfitobacterium hafniense DP7]|uniref:RND transporter n=2 Tax=Desulfitobacterium hafniense TaxID=49338 RepID=A0A0W1JCQ0_DESHA|nr:efflux RND transporter periplasmic adaptor subunit [Desulfitobacterium hafniense]EHL08521.1 efflux transporter, RND family, MFP subunit [Desulfitobacterium hafniense DP7]KTE89514.1 RND transporter [Desulfitobacterium hafniense]
MDKSKLLKKLRKPKRTTLIAALAVVVIGIWGITALLGGNKSASANVAHTKLAKTELINSVDVSGSIKSKNTQKVYSTLSYSVKEIYVNIGDKVEAGEPLAQLDTSSLELDIAQQRSTFEASQKTGTINLESKKRIYEDTKKQYENGMNTELLNAENSLKSAENDLTTKKNTYENNVESYKFGAVSKQELDQSEAGYKLAQNTYNKAAASLEAAKIKAAQDVKTAEANYNSALADYNNDSQKIALDKLEKNLADATIKAPISGVVTAVYAEAGSPGNGLLFVVEDAEKLTITTYVKEYDADKVKPGQMVNIKTDATEDELFAGQVVRISPASTKTANGTTDTSNTTVEFETEVDILEPDDQLKIGMNARLNIIIEKKADVYSVPYDAVSVNDQGQSIVYILTGENGQQRMEETVVEVGMMTDYYTEISGEGLADGVLVVNNAASAGTGDKARPGAAMK